MSKYNIKADATGVDIGIEQDKDIDETLKQFVPRNLIGIVSDQITAYRFKNQINIAVKIKKQCEANGFEPKAVAPHFAIPFFEEVFNEDNDKLQDLWVNLLLNKSKDDSVNKYYIDILRNIEPIEAKILELCYDPETTTKRSILLSNIYESLVPEYENITSDRLKVIIRKFVSLEVFNTGVREGVLIGKNEYLIDTVENFRWTELGIDLMENITKVR